MDLQENITHFPAMKQIQGERNISSHVEFIQKLIGNFSDHFVDFSLEEQVLLFIHNPFLVKNVTTFSEEAKITFKWVDMASLQMELVDLQANVVLKEQCGVSDAASFWLQAVPEKVFPGLTKVAVHILTIFGSTYSCESAFSTLNIIRTKYHSRMTNEHLHACLRMALAPFLPRFKILAEKAKANFSH